MRRGGNGQADWPADCNCSVFFLFLFCLSVIPRFSLSLFIAVPASQSKLDSSSSEEQHVCIHTLFSAGEGCIPFFFTGRGEGNGFMFREVFLIFKEDAQSIKMKGGGGGGSWSW